MEILFAVEVRAGTRSPSRIQTLHPQRERPLSSSPHSQDGWQDFNEADLKARGESLWLWRDLGNRKELVLGPARRIRVAEEGTEDRE